jgi:lysophospholipase L1-like esterase
MSGFGDLLSRHVRSRLRAATVWRGAAVTLLVFITGGTSIGLAAGPRDTHHDRLPGSGAATSSPNDRKSDGWVGTWASAQVEPGTTGLSSTGFNDQTVRDIIHTSVGGTEVRLRISNTFGTEPLVVTAVDVGIRSSGAAIEAGTNRQATFGGSDSITVQPGEDALSDPVTLKVSARQDLAVSIYFTGSTGPATWHPDALSTNYYAAGSEAADSSGTPFTNADTSWYFLDGVDVYNPRVNGAVVAFGPSTTDGDASTTNANERYPDDLARRLLQLPAGEQMSVLNAGISGNELLTDAGTDGAAGVARFFRDVVQQDGVRDVIIWEGSNDIGNQPTLNASELTDAYQELIAIAHQYGIKVIGATLQPDQGAGYYTTEGNTTREAVNNWVRTSGAVDGVADFSTVLQDPADTDELLPAYNSGDSLHPNDAGYQAIADSIDLQELTSPIGSAPVFSGTATPSQLSATVATNASLRETVTVHSLSNRTYTLPWSVSAPAGSGVTVNGGSGRVTIPAGGSAKVSFIVHSASPEGTYSLALNLFGSDGESALASHFTVAVDKPGDLSPFYNNTGISDDDAASEANLDGNGYSYSEQLLTAVGVAPGASLTAAGLHFVWPDVAAGEPDNVQADGQTLIPDVPAGASEIGFLGAGANSGTTGSEGQVTINYTDGTSTTEELGFGGYALGFVSNPTAPFGDTIVATLPDINYESGTPRDSKMYLFEQSLPVDPSKTVASIVLPKAVSNGQIHVFAISS